MIGDMCYYKTMAFAYFTKFYSKIMIRKLLFVACFSIFILSGYGQNLILNNERSDSTILLSSTNLNNDEFKVGNIIRYKLYPTDNMYTFLKLDTKTGKIEQLHWSLGTDYYEHEFTVYISNVDLSLNDESGVFELYPTQNMYQFILLDKTTGRSWHVQWGMEASKRWIRPIL